MYTNEQHLLYIKIKFLQIMKVLHKICSSSISTDILQQQLTVQIWDLKMNFSRFLFGKFQDLQGFHSSNNKLVILDILGMTDCAHQSWFYHLAGKLDKIWKMKFNMLKWLGQKQTIQSPAVQNFHGGCVDFFPLFEVAIESWPEWDLNPRPLNSVQTP